MTAATRDQTGKFAKAATADEPQSPAERTLSDAVTAWLADRSIYCDTPRCESVHQGSGWAGAVGSGWRTDATGLRRCPRCLAATWPGVVPDTGLTYPAELLEAHQRGDGSGLRAWLDETYGPLPQPVVVDGLPEPPKFADPQPWECPACHCLLERPGQEHEPCIVPVRVITVVPARPLGELEGDADAHMTAFLAIHEAEDGSGESPDEPPAAGDEPQDDPPLDETAEARES